MSFVKYISWRVLSFRLVMPLWAIHASKAYESFHKNYPVSQFELVAFDFLKNKNDIYVKILVNPKIL